MKTACTNAFVMTQHNGGESHQFTHVKQGLEKPDFFMVTGVGMKSEQPGTFKVCGHACLYTFNVRENGFESSSNI